MSFSVRRLTAAIAVLCLLAGFVIFRQKAREVRPKAISASSPLPSTRPSGDETRDRSVSRPVVHAIDQSPSPTVSSNPAPPTPAEIYLPPPPSGDFELVLTNEQIGAIVEKRYGGLLRTLGLPQERLDRFRALLIERQQVTVDTANAALLFGMNPVHDLPGIRLAIEQFQSSVDTTLRNEFGDPVFAAYRDFDRTIRERNSVGDFAQLLAAAREPLEPQQEKQMVQILKNSPGPDLPLNIEGVIYGGVNDRARIDEQAVAAAAAVLSPRQLELFRQLRQREPSEIASRADSQTAP
jgi:hypothetical protein